MPKRKFAISDIHGCYKTFNALLNKIDFSEDDELYLLGDYVDRGPDSKSLIDFIMGLQEKGYQVCCMRGNHEELLLSGFSDPQILSLWYRNGGLQTLESFQVESLFDIPQKYIDWFNALHYFHELDEYILVHAGLNFLADDPLTDREAMLWIRRWYAQIDYAWLSDRIIIHGHTPTHFSNILEYYNNLAENRHLVIDGGCVYKERGLGDLIAFEMGEKELFVQRNVD